MHYSTLCTQQLMAALCCFSGRSGPCMAPASGGDARDKTNPKATSLHRKGHQRNLRTVLPLAVFLAPATNLRLDRRTISMPRSIARRPRRVEGNHKPFTVATDRKRRVTGSGAARKQRPFQRLCTRERSWYCLITLLTLNYYPFISQSSPIGYQLFPINSLRH